MGRPRIHRAPCSVAECERPSKCLGLCVMHYQRQYRRGTTQLRIPQGDKGGFVQLVKFTPALWDRWRRELEPDVQTVRLRQGIAQMRQMLGQRRFTLHAGNG